MSKTPDVVSITVQEALAAKPFQTGIEGVGAEATGRAFITSLFLVKACEALSEKHWLLAQSESKTQSSFQAFLETACQRELAPLGHLAPLWRATSPAQFKAIVGAAVTLCRRIISRVLAADPSYYRAFVRQAVAAMVELTQLEREVDLKREAHFLPALLYRAFDLMDEIFGLGYDQEPGMSSPSLERLYLGAGVGVQTSYATILAVLEHLRPRQGAQFIDLGSGYGRLGLIGGLWRSDLQFTGYEYVSHRVVAASAAAERAGLRDRVRFIKQDLSDLNFVIPAADFYYMYDPFSDATYQQVLMRLKAVGRNRPVTIFTKAVNSGRFSDFASAEGWTTPQIHDGGNMLVLRNFS